uniref:Uncharacterized protein n=1 Tax=mine drainage metagenome TaxID=410659 RepID=E6QKZ6_9ZZZZ
MEKRGSIANSGIVAGVRIFGQYVLLRFVCDAVPRPERPGYKSHNLADKALEVFGFGEVQDDGVIDGCATPIEDTDGAVSINGGVCDGRFEVGPGNVMGAGAGDKQAAGT